MLDPLSISIPLPTSPSSPPRPTRKLLQPSPDHPDDYILELDYSSASKIIECARASENYLVKSREAARPSSATEFGKLFHKCEELRLRHGFDPAVKQQQLAMIQEHFMGHTPSPTDHRTAERMVAVLNQYESRYAIDEWPEKVYKDEFGWGMVETAFKVKLCTIPVNGDLPFPFENLVVWNETDGYTYATSDPARKSFFIRSIHVLYTGRIDLILRDSNLLWVVDHKTSSRGGNEFVEAFRHSLQTRGYTWAAQKVLGQPVTGLIMNALVIKPPTVKLFNNTELSRHSYFYSQDNLVEWQDNMTAIVSDFIAMLVRGYFPQYARSFKSPCAGCGYFDNCALPREQRADDLASETYRNVTWNPTDED